jgi:hypothetical protein
MWSHAELGMAARGVPELPWLAARFSFAGDMNCYWKLWYGLLFQAQRLAVRNNWRPQIPATNGEPKFYLEGLSRLVLDEDVHRPFFTAAPALYAVYMDVDDRVWQRLLAARHAMLKARYEIWLGTARAMIQRWLGDHDSADPADSVSRSTHRELRDEAACV